MIRRTSSASAFAGNPWLVDLDGLVDVGLLDHADLPDRGTDARIAYDAMRVRKLPQLRSAAERLLDDADHPWRQGFDAYVDESDWIGSTSHFFALKERHGGAPWWEWPDAIRRCGADALSRSRDELATEIATWEAVLYLFEVQWQALRATAQLHGVRILGDIPIYVAPDSSDVWLHQAQFELDANGAMIVQSGVPPDYFSADGQLWRNPLYRWDVMAADGFGWWISRLRRSLELSDIVRIDHFRALSAYWEVPGDADTAIRGRWAEGPGQALLDAVRSAFPAMPFVAEDLGSLDDAVHELRDANGLLGMRVVQFGFDGLPDNPHRPDAVDETCVFYTGTHDNEPIAAWWRDLDETTRDEVARVFGLEPDAEVAQAVWTLIEAVIASDAVAAVIPMQDLLVLDERSRMNVPATTSGNWSWRMPAGALTPELAESLRRLSERYFRV